MLKRICCILFCVGLCMPGKASLAQKKDLRYYPKHTPPSYHKADEGYAMRIDSALVIDGEYDVLWDRIHIHAIQHRVSGEKSALWNDYQGGFQLAWHEDYVFMHILVVDETPLLGEGDTVRVALKSEAEGSRYVFDLSPSEVVFLEGALPGLQYEVGAAPPSGSKSWEQKHGYSIELAIPLSDLAIDDARIATLGMNIWIADSDDGQEIESEWEWTGGIIKAGSAQRPMGKVKFISAYYAGSEEGFLPAQVWEEEEGVVIIEAEDIDRHSNWKLKTTPAGFTGTGYLDWQGDDWTVPPEPWVRRSNNDYSNERQPPQHEWLILRINIENAGTYMLDVRNIHKRFDGDNDFWFGRVGEAFHPGHPISRVGDNLKDGTGFTWLDWGVRELELDRGMHTYFLGGRSIGFGVDRIALYLKDKAGAKDKALDPRTPASKIRLE